MPPDEKDLQDIASDIGYKHLSVQDNYIYSDNDRLVLDFGATGKGYLLDKLYEDIRQYPSCSGCVVSVGSSIMVYGKKNDATSYEIGIRDPEKGISDLIGTVTIDSGRMDLHTAFFISTSGSYERYAMDADGTIYSHILDSDTLSPVEGDLISVTVIAGSGIVSDGLSTAVFVKGEAESVDFLEKYNAEAILVYANHDIHITDGLAESFNMTSSDYRVVKEV